MNKEQKKSIRKFERWQQRKFASNAKKGWRFFQPDSVPLPTPRSSREAWGGTYTNEDHDRRQEKYMTITIYVFMFIYIAFLVWKDF